MGKTDNMERTQIMNMLSWPAKEFKFYPEIFKVHLMEFTHGRDTGIFMVEKGEYAHMAGFFWRKQQVRKFRHWPLEDVMRA